jgi:hypothetical protein
MSLTLPQVRQLFDDMSILSCDPVTVTPPCIPYMYPFNGCWARAHQMCRLMLVQNITPQKVWIHGSLTVKSANSSNCTVNWAWHVAPIVQVDLGNGPQSYVIDPSIFTEPVPQAVWASVQGDPNPTLTVTPWTTYIGSTTDPYAYNQPDPWVDADLVNFRTLLHNESPPPPYAVCHSDVYIRDNLQDTGATPLVGGGISMSPDVNHYQQMLVDPQGTLGITSSAVRDDMFEQIKFGQPNYVYLRLQNRGNASAAADVDLYYTLPSTLPTPANWTLIGSLTTPFIVPGEFYVAGPITWGTVPQPGHYCFVAVLGTNGDPKPNIQSIQTVNDFYNLIRQGNNATWKNFDIIKVTKSKKVKFPFWIQGWPKMAYKGDLEIKLGKLPKGAKVHLQIANQFREGTKLKRMKAAPAKGRFVNYIVTPSGTSVLRDIKLKASVCSQASLSIVLPREVRPGAYDIAVLQKINGKEVGRVTRRLVIARKNDT